MAIETLDIPFLSATDYRPIVEGDTIPRIEFAFDSGIDLTTSTLKMQVYDNNTKILDVSDGNGITVTGALTYEFDEIPATNNPFRAGVFMGDLEITDGSGFRQTYYRVRYTITKQYTK